MLHYICLKYGQIVDIIVIASLHLSEVWTDTKILNRLILITWNILKWEFTEYIVSCKHLSVHLNVNRNSSDLRVVVLYYCSFLCYNIFIVPVGRWKGHVKQGEALCRPGWRVCSSQDKKQLTDLSWLDILDIKGCYAYNVGNDRRGKCRRLVITFF